MRSEPSFKTSALESGNVYEPIGTCSTAARYRAFGSMKMHGSLLSIAAKSRPFAWMGDLGMITRKPGICVNRLSGDCEWYLFVVSSPLKPARVDTYNAP